MQESFQFNLVMQASCDRGCFMASFQLQQNHSRLFERAAECPQVTDYLSSLDVKGLKPHKNLVPAGLR